MNSVKYNPERKILEIEFTSGAIYDYFDVPKSVFSSLTHTPSKGLYFNYYIKNHFDFQQITPKEHTHIRFSSGRGPQRKPKNSPFHTRDILAGPHTAL